VTLTIISRLTDWLSYLLTNTN